MPLREGDILNLTPEKPAAGGRMLARHEGRIVFVAGTIPGEEVRARITKVSRQLAFAETVEVLSPSPDRRRHDTDWACGGSHYQHIAYDRQLELKSAILADALGRLGRIVLPGAVRVMASPEHGYRTRARLHGSGSRVGFFREGTHDLCDPRTTGQLLPETIAALDALAHTCAAAGVSIASCDVVENIDATERAVYVETSGRPAALPDSIIAGISGLSTGGADGQQESIVYGSPFVTDRLAVSGTTITLTHHVRSFFQGNRHLLMPLVERVLNHVQGGVVFDLYAGVGLFAIPLAAGGAQVFAVEADFFSARDLAANASAVQGAIHVERQPVERALDARPSAAPSCVVLDPPRTGVSPEAMQGLIRLRAPKVVYVSCDPATLARDARRLIDAGYSLGHTEAFDLFPNTSHVETLAVFARG